MINKINQSLFVFFLNDCKSRQYCSILSAPLAVIKVPIILMFVEFQSKKFFQSCNARTGFIPIQDALRVVNDFLDQVFVCQFLVHCID